MQGRLTWLSRECALRYVSTAINISSQASFKMSLRCATDLDRKRSLPYSTCRLRNKATPLACAGFSARSQTFSPWSIRNFLKVLSLLLLAVSLHECMDETKTCNINNIIVQVDLLLNLLSVCVCVSFHRETVATGY